MWKIIFLLIFILFGINEYANSEDYSQEVYTQQSCSLGIDNYNWVNDYIGKQIRINKNSDGDIVGLKWMGSDIYLNLSKLEEKTIDINSSNFLFSTEKIEGQSSILVEEVKMLTANNTSQFLNHILRFRKEKQNIIMEWHKKEENWDSVIYCEFTKEEFIAAKN